MIAGNVKKCGTVLDAPGISPYGVYITGRDAPTPQETPAMTTQTITIADRTLRIRTTGGAARGYIVAVTHRNGRVIAESDAHAYVTQAAIEQAIRRATAALAA